MVSIISFAGCQEMLSPLEMDNSHTELTITASETNIFTSTPLTMTATPQPTEEPTQTVEIHTENPEPSRTPQPSDTPSLLEPSSPEPPACIHVYYEGFAQVELISSLGNRVLVDIHDPGKLSTPVSKQDILLTTHTHFDHVNDNFLSSFPGQQLFARTGKLSAPGLMVTGIASAHNSGERLRPEGGTNYIYLVEMDGFRIAHFGDIGQDALNQDQLDQLGSVDIAISQLANPYSDMNIQNRKGLKLIEQIKPGFIIPTHLNLETATAAVEQWGGTYTDNPYVMICQSQLPEETQILLLGENALQFAERLNLPLYK